MGNRASASNTFDDDESRVRGHANAFESPGSDGSLSHDSSSRRGQVTVSRRRRASPSSENCPTPQHVDAEDTRPPREVDDFEIDGRDSEHGQEMSYWQMAKVGYQELVNAIIRPPRAEYDMAALGPVEFDFMGKPFQRVDFELRNERGLLLQCSSWEPKDWRPADQLPCLIYMHGNSSARVEAVTQISLALSLGATLVAFDFAGSGQSEGEHVSLGYYEREDLKRVIKHLRDSGRVGAIALWGRSMGAATALLHGDRDPSIAALVLDSAFTDLTQLAEEMVEKGREAGLVIPSLVVKLVLRMIRGSVLKSAGFNVRDLCPVRHANLTYIPAIFVAARGDDFIRPHHSRQIHDAYAGDKNLIIVEGDHNSPRPGFLFDSVYIFLQRYLMVPQEWGLEGGDNLIGKAPWLLDPGAGLLGEAGEAGHRRLSEEDFGNYVEWGDVGDGMGEMGMEEGSGVSLGAGEMGMTRVRQMELQEALFQMVAQEHPGSSKTWDNADAGILPTPYLKRDQGGGHSLGPTSTGEGAGATRVMGEPAEASWCWPLSRGDGEGGLGVGKRPLPGQGQGLVAPLQVSRQAMKPLLAPGSPSETSSCADPGFERTVQATGAMEATGAVGGASPGASSMVQGSPHKLQGRSHMPPCKPERASNPRFLKRPPLAQPTCKGALAGEALPPKVSWGEEEQSTIVATEKEAGMGLSAAAAVAAGVGTLGMGLEVHLDQ
ncbi:unnamed protein product [Discosporangium mesarthrocarpum]